MLVGWRNFFVYLEQQQQTPTDMSKGLDQMESFDSAKPEACASKKISNDSKSAEIEDNCRIVTEEDNEPPLDIEIDSDTETESAGTTSIVGAGPPRPPSIPSFVDHMLVGDLPPQAREQLKFCLDVGSVGEAIKNWEWLASYFGMNWTEIKFLQERVVYPNSPTLEVLWRFRNQNLGQVLRLIRDKLRQYSLIIKLVPIFNEYQEEKEIARAQKFVAKRSDSVSDADSGVISNSGLDSVASDSLASVSRQWRWPELQLQERTRNGATEISRDVEADLSSEDSQSAGPSASNNQEIFDNTKRKVLLTFYPDNDEHVKYVRWLQRNLKKYGASVVRDDDLSAGFAESVSSTLESAFREADQIIAVISPRYKLAVEAHNNGVQLPSSGDNGRTQIVRYLYTQMNAEYVQNNSINLRFRPVIFDGVGGNCTVPPLFRNTIVFHWPSMHNDLFRLVFDEPLLSHRRDSDHYSLAAQSVVSL